MDCSICGDYIDDVSTYNIDDMFAITFAVCLLCSVELKELEED